MVFGPDDAPGRMDRQYRKKIEASGFKTVLSYGVAFFQKSCRIMSHIAWRKKNGKLGNAD